MPKNKGNRGTQAIFRNREHRKSRFCLWGTREQGHYFEGEQGNRYPPPPREGFATGLDDIPDSLYLFGLNETFLIAKSEASMI